MWKFLQALAYLTRTDRPANRMEYIIGMLAISGFMKVLSDNSYIYANVYSATSLLNNSNIIFGIAHSLLSIMLTLSGLVIFVIFVMAFFALHGRRLRDLGHNPINSIFIIVPIVNVILILYLVLFPGKSN